MSVNNGKVHIAEKPVELMEDILQITKPKAMILDMFCGSGSTGIAAIKTGRRCTLIEKEERYVEICIRRVEQAQRQIRMPLEVLNDELR